MKMRSITQYSLIIVTSVLFTHLSVASSNKEIAAKNVLNVNSAGHEIISPKQFSGIRDNKINGVVPPGNIGGINKVLLYVTVDGMNHYVSRMIRAAGLRTAVYYHHYPVTTCVLEGETTFYLDGYSPKTTKAGHCFVMPANIKGSNYNSGKTTQILLDFMVLPKGVATIVPFEKVPKNEDQM
jgi:quercetin dioxygenase-like cupin family protein